jgi:hypothetical protein
MKQHFCWKDLDVLADVLLAARFIRDANSLVRTLVGVLYKLLLYSNRPCQFNGKVCHLSVIDTAASQASRQADVLMQRQLRTVDQNNITAAGFGMMQEVSERASHAGFMLKQQELRRAGAAEGRQDDAVAHAVGCPAVRVCRRPQDLHHSGSTACQKG